MSRLPIALCFLLISLFSQSAAAAGLKVRAVEVELVAQERAVRPGQALEVGLRIRHDPHWHTYWRNAGDSGLATEVHWKLPAGFAIDAIQWPAPSLIRVGPLANFGFEDEIVLAQRLHVPADVQGAQVRLQAKADWLMCKDVCIPGTAELNLDLPVERRVGAKAEPSAAAPLFESMVDRRPLAASAVDVSVQDGGLAVRLPLQNEAPRSVRFFPYSGGLIANPAEQTLSEVEQAAPIWRLQLLPAEGLSVATGATAATGQAAAVGQAAAAGEPTRTLDAALGEARFFSGAPVGVLEIDGRAFEVAAASAPPLPPGTPRVNRFEDRVIQAPLGATPDKAGGGLFANAAARLGIGLGRDAASSRMSDGVVGNSSSGRTSSGVPAAGGQSVPEAGRPADGGAPGGAAAAATDGRSIDVAAGSVAGAGGATVPLGWALSLAFLGGVLLNLMPCVFPIIGLKVLGFAQGGGADGRPRAQALAFAAGVLVSFWVLALVLNGLESAGRAAGWGFQLQSPVFVALMGLLFVSIGLNLAGVFEFGLGMTRLGNLDRPTPGLSGSFASGLLAVLVATPCTAPFMGSALGLTLGEPLPRVLTVFTALGLGMSLPYLLLALWPALLRKLPRPGPWMESLRQFLAFPMFITAAWLAWVLAQQVDSEAWLHWSVAAILLALAWWIHGRFVQRAPGGPGGRHLAGRFAALAVGLTALWLALPLGADAAAPVLGAASGEGPRVTSEATAVPGARSATASTSGSPAGARAGDGMTGGLPAGADRSIGQAWQPWSLEAVAAAQAAGRPVFVDFTAAWCVTCQVNKRLVLQRPGVIARMAALDVLKLHADWTRMDEGIRAELARHGRSGVPLYLVYRPGETTPQILPEVLTPGIVLAAFGEPS